MKVSFSFKTVHSRAVEDAGESGAEEDPLYQSREDSQKEAEGRQKLERSKSKAQRSQFEAKRMR